MKPRTWLCRILGTATLLALLLPLSPSQSLLARQGSLSPSTETLVGSAPAAIVNLVADTGAAAGTVDLSWTAPGDDATTGTASAYIVRYNTTTITESNWDTSSDVTGEPTPSPAGSVESMTVSGLTPGQTYHFAIKTQDEVPNTSSISNSPRVAAQMSGELAYLPLVLSGSGVPVEIPETTEVLTQATTQYLSEVSSDGSVFTFTQSTAALDALAPGDVVVSDVTANAPSGFLRKVTSVVPSGGQIVVETEAATLEEAIESGETRLSDILTPDQIQGGAQLDGVTLEPARVSQIQDEFYFKLEDVVLYDDDGNPGTENDQVRADGTIRLEPGFDFDLVVRDYELQELSFTTSAVETVELEVEAEVELLSVEEEKEIARYILSPLTAMVGPVPVVIVPILTINVGVDGDVHVGVTAGVQQQATVMAGLRYAGGVWQPVSYFSNEFHHTPPTLSAGVDVKGYAGAQLSLLLYGVIGPYAEIDAYLELEADVSEDPWWTLWGGLEASGGVKVEVLGHSIADYESPIMIGYRLALAQAQTNSPPDMPFSSYPIDGAIVQNLDANLIWSGGDLDSDDVTYDVYFESGDVTPDVLVSDDQTDIAYDPGTLSANIHYYWRILAKDEHGATTAGPVWEFTTGEVEVMPGEMILIPAGEFQMGCDSANPSESCNTWEQPLHTVYLDAYYIDKYEVTNAQFAQCVAAESCGLPISSSFTRDLYYGNPIYDDYPVIYIQWWNAEAYCTWVGKRLPTEAEWEKAARGSSDTRMYPWGNEDPDCLRLNYVSGNVYCVGDTSRVGSYPGGASPYGVMDMAGNVLEWTNDWYQEGYYSVSPYSNPLGPTYGTTKVVRGWSFANRWDYMRVARRGGGNPSDYSMAHGFRCAEDAP